LHALPRHSVAVCFTSHSGYKHRPNGILVSADFVAKVAKYQATIFSKETKLNYARRLIWHPGRQQSRL
jgi:hypothetical protein